MKKSECYKLAEMAVLNDTTLPTNTKLEVLRVLMEEENIQTIVERNSEKGDEK